ncbi:hypothetical protein M2447_000539 [Ereboglobus sp. PH5-10]|uniref:hypothetical protein n=1 Tax=Ereboglobus sp. PH5-10 TaxID=2940629 RepID=UPI0024066631|nr:hypothetical protein [Ereboglobus sp. PH5-10]MDF9826458.1 hypothetical protein [Ereboglobus sp. PH5-10]
MTMFKRPLLLLPLLLALMPPDVRCAGEPAPPTNPLEAYKTKITNDATITYPADEQAFADEILLSYQFPLRILDDASFEAQLARWKKNDLALIAKKLALEKPTEAMSASFDQFRDICRPAVVEEIGVVRIYHFSDIKAAQASGSLPDGLGYNPENEALSIANHITAPRAGRARARVVPIVLMKKAPGMTDEKMRLFNATIRDMRWRLDEAVYNAYCGKLYEIARPSIIATIDKASFPLWIVDGMVNIIPISVLRSHNPNLSYEQLLQAHTARPSDFETHAAGINLDTWIGTRTAATPKAVADSYSYLAMLVILDAIEENGEDWIPPLFERMRAQNSPAFNMGAIYKIYTEITGGKDLRENIAIVKERLAKKRGANPG